MKHANFIASSVVLLCIHACWFESFYQISVVNNIVNDENPDDILQEVLAGIEKHEVTLIINRLDAIKHIIYSAEDNDIILILGIGDYQDLPIGGLRIYYNEIEAIKLAIAHRQMNEALLGL